jgi:transcriptional regulator with XRE-family HTH domain
LFAYYGNSIWQRRKRKRMTRKEKNKLEEIGNHVRKLRRIQWLTQAELAERMGIAQITLSRIENGTTPMNILTLGKMAESLEVSATEIMNLDEDL